MPFAERLQEIRTGFERPFWIANLTEIFERLSYYGAYAALAIYLQASGCTFRRSKPGRLRAFLVSSGFLRRSAERLPTAMGFRRALATAYLILSVSYFLLGSIEAPWMAPVRSHVSLAGLVGFILLLPAFGIALVKPCVVGTTSRASKENVRSIGFSIYYTMVNVGGFLGPFLASWIDPHLGVENVFRVAAVSVFAMFFVVLLFFPSRERSTTLLRPRSQRSRRKFLPGGGQGMAGIAGSGCGPRRCAWRSLWTRR